jgi:hypothetical protein
MAEYPLAYPVVCRDQVMITLSLLHGNMNFLSALPRTFCAASSAREKGDHDKGKY